MGLPGLAGYSQKLGAQQGTSVAEDGKTALFFLTLHVVNSGIMHAVI